MANQEREHKKIVYQVFTRLFGNTNTTNKPWGTIEENGVGKFNVVNGKGFIQIELDALESFIIKL